MKQVGMGLFFLTLVTFHCYAVDIHGGKLLSDRQFSIGNIRGHFRDLKSTPRIHSKTVMDSIELSNRVYDVTGDTVNQTTVEANSRIYVENTTQSPQTYQVNGGICLGDNDMCLMRSLSFELDPNGYIDINRLITADHQFQTAGTYTSELTTTISRLNGATLFTTRAQGTTIIS